RQINTSTSWLVCNLSTSLAKIKCIVCKK
ncbi:trkA-N domain protein, partial [Vibrio parahaemolyticus V-223/04]